MTGDSMAITSNADRLRQSLGFMDDGCDGCVPEECGDKMVATIANDAADEIEALRSLLTEIADHFDPEGLLGVESVRGWRDIYDDLVPFRSDSGSHQEGVTR